MPDTFEGLADLLTQSPDRELRPKALSLRVSPALDFSIRFMAERLHIPHTRLAAMLLETAAEQFGPICKSRIESVPGNLMIDPSPSKVGDMIGEGLDEKSLFGTRTKEEHEADFNRVDIIPANYPADYHDGDVEPGDAE
jgi:hypothetical protein